MQISEVEKHYRENRKHLVKRAFFRTGSHEAAEDVVQEVYYRILKYKAFNAENPDKWVSTILGNCIKDWHRQEEGYVAVDEVPEEEAENVKCPHYPAQVMREVYELIETKAVIQQEVLNLHLRYEYSAKDISEITEHSYANCHKIISRFREELRTLYRE